MIGILATLGGRLRQLREARGWSQRRLATAAGLSTGYIVLVENGHRLPSLETTVLLAELCGAPPQALLTNPLPEEWLEAVRAIAARDADLPAEA